MKLDSIFMNPNGHLKIKYGLLSKKRLTIAKRRLTTRNIHVLYAIVSNFNLTVIQILKKKAYILQRAFVFTKL